MTPPIAYGLQNPGPMRGTRVLKAHREAARAAANRLLETLGPEETSVSDEAATAIAAAVIGAEDSIRTEYVIGVRTERGGTVILGPYRTRAAAERALRLGIPLPGSAGLFPLIPFPKHPGHGVTPPKKERQ